MLIEFSFGLAFAANPSPCANEGDLSKEIWLNGKGVETPHILLRLDMREIEMSWHFDHGERITQYCLWIQ